MKCVALGNGMDVCVTVKVKIIDRRPLNGKLQDALECRELELRAGHIGRQTEDGLAEEIRSGLMEKGEG